MYDYSFRFKIENKNDYCANDQYSLIDNLCTNPCLFRINKIEHNLREFCYKGEANDKLCIFRIDTIQYFHNKSKIYRIGCIKNRNNCNVKYHTGKQIIKYKTITKV